MPIHTSDHIRRRRERVALLLAKGANPREISEALEISLRTVHSDIKWFNTENERRLFEMAKQTIPTLYQNCLTGINELIKQCWQMYVRTNTHTITDPDGVQREEPNDPKDWIHQRTRLEALRLAGDLTEAKFNMIQNGPAIFELKKLERKVNELRSGIELPI